MEAQKKKTEAASKDGARARPADRSARACAPGESKPRRREPTYLPSPDNRFQRSQLQTQVEQEG